MNVPSRHMSNSEVYGAADVLGDIWKARWTVLSVTFILCLVGVAAGLALPKQYTASVIFEPVLSETGAGGGALGSMSSGSGGLSGLAALAGIALPGKSQDEEALAVLQSQLLTRSFLEKNDLLPILFRGKWNSEAKRWKVSNEKDIPTLWQANRVFAKKIRKVNKDQKTGLYKLTIRWTNPQLAAKWANDLVAMTNDDLRNQAVREAARNIKYLYAQADQTTDVEVKQVIYSLLESQIDKEMIARGRKEYALKVIDPAFVPQRPSSLGSVALGIIGLLVGGFSCILIIFFRGALRAG